jgi:hypothetical protein
MKSFLVGVMALITSMTALGQEGQPVFQKAYDLSMGTRADINSQIEWIAKNQAADVLICYEDDKITVYSKETQTYRVINKTYETDDYATWLAVDKNGRRCTTSAGIHAETKLLFLRIEYVDTVIVYLTKPN